MQRAMIFVVGVALITGAAVEAQGSGSRGSVSSGVVAVRPGPDHFAAEHYVTITGRAEVRLAPSAIRVVLALANEAEHADECRVANLARQKALSDALAGIDVERGGITVDFISLLPVYHWEVEVKSGRKVAVESLRGYRLQNNVHVRVSTEERAQAVIAEAFKVGVTDVLAIDYGSDKIDGARVEAQTRALAEAKRKADLLLGALFEEQRPSPINIHEDTRVMYPSDLYASFENAYAQHLGEPFLQSGNLMRISAFRPKNTYYRGVRERVDVGSGSLPMRPEISVVSTIALYYAAPGRPSSAPK